MNGARKFEYGLSMLSRNGTLLGVYPTAGAFFVCICFKVHSDRFDSKKLAFPKGLADEILKISLAGRKKNNVF